MGEIIDLHDKPDPDKAITYLKEKLDEGGINCCFVVGLDEDNDPFIITGFTELEVNEAFAIAAQIPFLIYENTDKEVSTELLDE